jgi:serine protease AprX
MAGDDHEGPTVFDPKNLDRAIITRPLLLKMADEQDSREPIDLIIDLNLQHEAGLRVAREIVYIEIVGYRAWLALDRDQGTVEYLTRLSESGNVFEFDTLARWRGVTQKPLNQVVDLAKARYTSQYVYPNLTVKQIQKLADFDIDTGLRPLFRMWPDFEVGVNLTKSVATVKGDAARATFAATGKGIVWAVADTGVDSSHVHFEEHMNLNLDDLRPLAHMNFVGDTGPVEPSEDPHGHGTHVAGIIAGESPIRRVDPDVATAGDDSGEPRWVPERWEVISELDTNGDRLYSRRQLKEPIAGVAPMTKLLSLRVLNSSGTGKVSNLLAAIGYVQEMNDHGRLLRIHGMNMSVGYGFDPEWFGCGQSPLCVEVNRLVRSGVSVVVAAGNTGYWKRGGTEAAINSGLDLTINDPGNAELAITVGSTHRDKPHTYGVSYFSSKGPTGDGRLKPDLVAPGEKVISCATGDGVKDMREHLSGSDDGELIDYRQESGTSMAAPHVSGAIAAFMSARNEFIGQPQRVKKIFTQSATDLGRDKYFQGHGLVDLMRAMQTI